MLLFAERDRAAFEDIGYVASSCWKDIGYVGAFSNFFLPHAQHIGSQLYIMYFHMGEEGEEG